MDDQLTSSLHELALGCRVLADEGHNDLTLGHLSLRDQRGEGFWLKRAGIGLEEVRGPDDFVLLSFEGERIEGEGAIHKEWPIHAEILRARPDLHVVGHTHAPWATRLACTTEQLRAVGNYGVLFAGGVPRFEETSELIDNTVIAQCLAATFADARAALIRDHGVVFGGDSVGQAVLTAIFLERAAKDQLLIAASGLPYSVPSRPELDRKGSKTVAPQAFEGFWDYLRRNVS